MASINPRPLKAYVRFDGTGRIVPSSLILRRKMPKVGKWKEIPAYECCNSTPTTTTTTTQGGGVTPTAFIKSYWLNVDDACNTTTYGSLVFYSSSSTIEAGIAIFTDASLTIPVTLGRVILAGPFNMTKYLVGAGGVLSEYNCPTITTYRVGNNSYNSFSEACAGGGDIGDGTTLYGNGSGYEVGTQLYYDQAFQFPYTFSGWRPAMVNFPFGNSTGMFLSNGIIQAGLPC